MKTIADKNQQSIKDLARIMDAAIKIPGTNISIGLDALLGLVPGIGDSAGFMVSLYIVYRAAKMGVPRLILVRMLVNILIDTVLGAIPLLGDIFDVAWKANIKNAELINRYTQSPSKEKNASIFAIVLILFALGFLVLGMGVFVKFLFTSL